MGMIWGAPDDTVHRGERLGGGHAALALSGGLLLAVGAMMPGAIKRMLELAVTAVTAGGAG